MATATFSVIIPAYNAGSTIRRAVDSVLAQTHAPLEVIIVDDGSEDDLAKVVQRYPAPVRYVYQRNANAAAARNRGIDLARGQWIAFLDADDHWRRDKLEHQQSIVKRHPEVAIIGSRFFQQQSGDLAIDSACPRVPLSAQLSLFDRVHRAHGSGAFQLSTMFWTGTVAVRREVLAVERFVSGLEPAEDRDLWMRVISRYPSYLSSEPLATAVLEPGGISRQSISRDCQKMLEVIDRHQQVLSRWSRQQWRAYTFYRWAAIETSPATAFPLLVRSLIGWPVPFLGLPAMQRWGRLRRLVTLAAQGSRIRVQRSERRAA